jgi:putative transposase
MKNKEDIESKRIQGSLNYYDNARELAKLKKELEWLTEVNSQSLQATLKDLEGSYRNFFRKTHRFPRYKNKYNPKQSYKVPQHIRIREDGRIQIPKFKEGIKAVIHRPIEGKILSAFISKKASGKYYISVSCECEKPNSIKQDKAVGVDLGIKDLAITSEGVKYENPKYYIKAQSKLKYIQRKYSRHKGKQTKRRLALLHEKVANQRHDYLHKISKELIDENQAIILENLCVKRMLQNSKLAKHISDSSLSSFVNYLQYKADWYDREIIQIDRFFPSSKTCSNCGYVKQDLTLKDREWTCPECKFKLDRDINASLNILKQGLNKCGRNYRVKQCELPTLVGAITTEASAFRRG